MATTKKCKKCGKPLDVHRGTTNESREIPATAMNAGSCLIKNQSSPPAPRLISGLAQSSGTASYLRTLQLLGGRNQTPEAGRRSGVGVVDSTAMSARPSSTWFDFLRIESDLATTFLGIAKSDSNPKNSAGALEPRCGKIESVLNLT